MKHWMPKLHPYQVQILKQQGISATAMKRSIIHGPGKTYYLFKFLIARAKVDKSMAIVTVKTPRVIAAQLRGWGYPCRAYRKNVIGRDWRLAVVTIK